MQRSGEYLGNFPMTHKLSMEQLQKQHHLELEEHLTKKDLELDTYKLDFLKYKEENEDLLLLKD